MTITATAAIPFTLSVHSLLANNAAGNVVNFNPATYYSFTIATATEGITGLTQDNFLLDLTEFTNPDPGTWSLAVSSHDLNLVYTASAIPEPATAAALAGFAVLALAVWRRRARRHC